MDSSQLHVYQDFDRTLVCMCFAPGALTQMKYSFALDLILQLSLSLCCTSCHFEMIFICWLLWRNILSSNSVIITSNYCVVPNWQRPKTMSLKKTHSISEHIFSTTYRFPTLKYQRFQLKRAKWQINKFTVFHNIFRPYSCSQFRFFNFKMSLTGHVHEKCKI